MSRRFFDAIAEDVWTLLFAFLSVGVLTAVSWGAIPAEVPIHWNWAGEADGFASREFAIALMPVGALVTYLVIVLALALDPRRENVDRAKPTIGLFRIMTPLSLLALHMLMLATWVEAVSFDVVSMIYAGSGLLFAISGNYMPRLKPNHVVGIRVPWTIDDDEVWRRTHRVGGSLWLVGGLSLFGALLLPPKLQFVYFLAVTTVITVVPIVYAYFVYKELHPADA